MARTDPRHRTRSFLRSSPAGTGSSMSREDETKTEVEQPRPTRAQRLSALGFLIAFALTIITVLWTSHRVHSPGAGRASEPTAGEAVPPAAVAPGENPTRRKESGETPPRPAR